MTTDEKRSLMVVTGLLVIYLVASRILRNVLHVSHPIESGLMFAYALIVVIIIAIMMKRWFNHDIGLRFTRFAGIIPIVFYVLYVGQRLISGAIAMQHHDAGQIVALTLDSLEAGVLEEAIMRAGLFYLLLRLYQKHANGPLLAALVSTGIFGVLHFMNLTAGQDFVSTLAQVLGATSMGLIFTALYARTGSILYGMIFHFAGDFTGMASMGSNIMHVSILALGMAAMLLAVMLIIMIVFVFPRKKVDRNSVLLRQ